MLLKGLVWFAIYLALMYAAGEGTLPWWLAIVLSVAALVVLAS